MACRFKPRDVENNPLQSVFITGKNPEITENVEHFTSAPNLLATLNSIYMYAMP
jgi:hypothetical protein